MTKRWLLSIAVLALISTRAAANDLPIQIPYTGFLQKGATPFSGSIPIQVTLTATDSSGNKTTWTEGHPTVSVNGGRFNILLGSITPIPPAFVNTALASGTPLTLTLIVNGIALNGTQTIYPSAFASATTGAKSSPSDFTTNGKLTINDLADATSSLLSTVADALQITGVGLSGSRLIRLFDDVLVNRDLTVGGNLVAIQGLKADLDTGWFAVTSNSLMSPPVGSANPLPNTIYRDPNDSNVVVLYHNLGFVPSQMMIQACGHLDGANNCTTEVTMLSSTGYHDAGGGVNPEMVRADLARIYMYIVPGWMVWGYYTNGWTCPVAPTVANCFSAFMRVRAWH